MLRVISEHIKAIYRYCNQLTVMFDHITADAATRFTNSLSLCRNTIISPVSIEPIILIPRSTLPVFRVGSIEEVGTYPMKSTHRNRMITVTAPKSGISIWHNFLPFSYTPPKTKNGTLRECFSASYDLFYISASANISGRLFRYFLALDTQAQTRLADTPNSFPISLLARPQAANRPK